MTRPAGANVVRASIVCLLLVAAGMAFAQQAPAPVVPEGQPSTDRPLRDVEFGVGTHQFGLQRKVEMYQWRRYGPGYRKVWEAQPIDSSTYAEAYRNPGAFPIQTRYWIATRVVLDGKPVDEDVLKVLGQWRGFRPGFSALPGNLSATFQPEGDGLGSAENPLDPQVGDLRVTWRELELPPLESKLVMEQGNWVLKAEAAVAGARPASTVGADDGANAPSPWRDRYLLPVAVAAVVLLLALAILVRRRRTRGT